MYGVLETVQIQFLCHHKEINILAQHFISLFHADSVPPKIVQRWEKNTCSKPITLFLFTVLLFYLL